MARVELNATIDKYRGAIGEIVFKHVRGKIIATKKPVFTKEPSAAQRAQRQRFREGTDYAKMAQADPVLRQLYEPVARERQVAVFTVALRDFLNPPSIQMFWLPNYQGEPGDPICIHTSDDVGVAELEVSLTALDGTPVERGQAAGSGLHSGCWIYTTTAEAAPGTRLHLEVTAADHAGNRVRAAAEITVRDTGRIDNKESTILPRGAALRDEAPPPVENESEQLPDAAPESAPGLQDPDPIPVHTTDAGEQNPASEPDHAPEYVPAPTEPAPLALAKAPAEPLPPPLLWWALLAAARLHHRAEAAAQAEAEPALPQRTPVPVFEPPRTTGFGPLRTSIPIPRREDNDKSNPFPLHPCLSPEHGGAGRSGLQRKDDRRPGPPETGRAARSPDGGP